MSFDEAVEWLYRQLPMYQRIGAAAYKKDLTNTVKLLDYFGNPHIGLKCIHVAGTNGKGSLSHMLAAAFQLYGFKTGLYTSPHLRSFTERVRINGSEIDRDYVVGFVKKVERAVEEIRPSFFEITVALAFCYFRDRNTDISIIETGLGGRLDSTNVVCPQLSVITNIGWDHQALLGDTLYKIATEKAGILKKGVPAVVGQYRSSTVKAFEKSDVPLTFSDRNVLIQTRDHGYRITHYELGEYDVKGVPSYGATNIGTFLECINQLKTIHPGLENFIIPTLEQYKELTGLKGRWQLLSENPMVIADTGHNVDGVRHIVGELEKMPHDRLHMVWGSVKDKDIEPILKLLPKNAFYYFCKPQIDRGMSSGELRAKAANNGLNGIDAGSVRDAIDLARTSAGRNDLIFIGGSTFVVAEIEEL